MQIAFGVTPASAGRPVVLNDARAGTLRLQDAATVLGLQPLVGRTAGGDDQMAAVEEALAVFADPWSRTARLFLSRYFRFVKSETAAHETEIRDHLAGHGDVFDWRDVMFLAPIPLPRVEIRTASSIVTAAFAFRVGGSTIAVNASADHPELCTVSLTAGALHDDEAFRRSMPRTFREFWRDPELPRGPLGSRLAQLPKA